MKLRRQSPIIALLGVCLAAYAGTKGLAMPASAVPPVASFAAGEPDPPSPAAVALFVNSNLDSAHALASAALRKNAADLDALFVEMEAAALAADTAGELGAALRLAKAGRRTSDPRVLIASARTLDLAGNTQVFRSAVPGIRKLIAARGAPANFLRAALLAAAADGVSTLSVFDLARESGLITDWRATGPFGAYPNVAFERKFAPEEDNLSHTSYDGRTVEAFRFYDGNFSLPDYFSTAGVFYAASDLVVSTAGEYRLRAESSGTLELFVDGASALKKDDRERVTPEIAWSSLRLTAGRHKLLVKFLLSATPFRIALLPARGHRNTSSAPAGRSRGARTAGAMRYTRNSLRARRAREVRPIAEPEASYVSAALRFWMGDYDAAITQLTALRQTQPSAAVDLLLAQAWEHSAENSPERLAALESTLRQAPLAMAAEYQLAAHAYNSGRVDEALARARRVVAARPAFVPGQHILAQAAMQLRAQAEAAAAFGAEVRLHPSCATVRSAVKFFSSLAAYGHAEELTAQLEGCAPGSLAYAETLAEAGHHREAASAARRVVLARPLDREARALLVRELALAGDRGSASRAAQELVALAPQTIAYRRLAEQVRNGDAVFDSSSPRGRDFAASEQFYTPYRRDGLKILRKTASRHFSGGPAVVLLHDRVARLQADGSVSLYVHKITRLVNREAIEKYGEVDLPRNAELLELRTLKQDGTVVEPEFNQHKSTISMLALAPGDAIEQEYVLHYAGGIDEHPDAFQYRFGSFTAPILYARFVVLSPQQSPLDEVLPSQGAPAPSETVADGTITRIWEQQDIAQSTEEVSAPRAETLPTVRLVASRRGRWQDVQDFYRNEVIEAARIGARVQQNASALRSAGDEPTARRLYRMVTPRIRSTNNGFRGGDTTSAEDTLANYAGSRTVTLLALARAAGLDAELLLARELDQPRPAVATRDAYTHPLVLFHFGDKEVAADAESEGLAFGVLPQTISHTDALAVPLTESYAVPASTAAPAGARLIVPVPASGGDEHSNADGDIIFDAQGNMSAHVLIRMGAARSAQMRNILSGIEPAGRRHFIEQIAMRIFPGALGADGEVRNESDPERPLELELTCRVPRLLIFNGDTADLDQLAPALGLRKMYGLGPRRWPLYIDMPLIETTTFRVHLPAGVKVVGETADRRIQSEFGSYSLAFRRPAEDQIEMQRAFRIPVQLVAPDRFEAFARFERQIEEVERQRLTLLRPSAARTAGGN